MARGAPFWVVIAMFLASLALGGFGIFAAFVGFADQSAISNVYAVGFGRPNEGCAGGAVMLNIADGEPLGCSRSPGYVSAAVKFPGFTDEQNRAVLQLARERAALSAQDRIEIQKLVDSFAADVPDEVAVQYFQPTQLGPLMGIGLGLVGVAAVAVSGVLWFWAKRV